MVSTIKDVAKYTGLSIATISKYINGGNVKECNKTVIDEAISVLDYHINESARGLKTSKTKTVGLLVPNLTSTFCNNIVSSIEDILLENGYSTIICDYKSDCNLEKKKLDFLRSKNVDGVILMPSGKNIETLNNILDRDIKLVLVDRLVENVECDVILVDNLNASYNAIEELIIRGHKKIGLICGPDDVYTTQERLRGYLRVHEDYRMAINEKYIRYGNYSIESGYEIFKELISCEDRPTAIFITNYEMTIGGMMAVNEIDINIPDDISVIGFDNLELTKIIKPSLSIVMQPMKEIGEVAANTLLNRLKDENADFPTMARLKTDVIIQKSIKNI